MIQALLSGIFKLVINLLNILLSPIDSLISSTLPDLSTALNAFNSLIDYIISVIGFAVDMSGLSSTAISLIIIYFSFILLSRPVVYVVKLALKWYNTLKP